MRDPKVDDYEVLMLLGGDLKFILGTIGSGGASCGHPCGQCEVPASDLCSTDLEELKKIKKRTVRDLKLYSHTAVGEVCPVCRVKIKEVDLDSVSESVQKKHMREHFGVKLGRAPLTDIEPKNHIICLLHVLLRLISNLWQATVVPFLTDSNTDALLAFLQRIGVEIPKRKLAKVGKSFDLYNLAAAVKKHNFNGAAAMKLLVNSNELCDIMHKSSGEASAKSDSARAAELQCRNLWRQFIRFWTATATDFDDASEVEQHTQADKIEAEALAFIELWNNSAGRNRSLYMHYILVHLPDQVRAFGDLRPYSGQGLEHLHSIFKKLLFTNTNRRKNDRVRQEAICVVAGALNPGALSAVQAEQAEQARTKRKRARLCKKAEKGELLVAPPLLALGDITGACLNLAVSSPQVDVAAEPCRRLAGEFEAAAQEPAREQASNTHLQALQAMMMEHRRAQTSAAAAHKNRKTKK